MDENTQLDVLSCDMAQIVILLRALSHNSICIKVTDLISDLAGILSAVIPFYVPGEHEENSGLQ
jgi:hypothetical protein